MKRRDFFQVLGLGGVGLGLGLSLKGSNEAIAATPARRVKLASAYWPARPQSTADDLVHEMQCWVHGVQDCHDLAIEEQRAGVRSRVAAGSGYVPHGVGSHLNAADSGHLLREAPTDPPKYPYVVIPYPDMRRV